MAIYRKYDDEHESENLPIVNDNSTCGSCAQMDTCDEFTDVRIRTSAVEEIQLIFDLLSKAVSRLKEMSEEDVFVSDKYLEQFNKRAEKQYNEGLEEHSNKRLEEKNRRKK
jgi:hypothetical protein